MTTLAERPASDVTTADADDLNAAITHALDHAGCTFDDLAEQAKSGHFQSVRARLAWVAVGDLMRSKH